MYISALSDMLKGGGGEGVEDIGTEKTPTWY